MRVRPRRAVPYVLAFVLGLGAAGLTACGDKTNRAMIPAERADQLKGDLDDVLSAIDSHDCTDAQRALAQVKSDLLSLPSGTSKRLQSRLNEGVARLSEQAAKECQEETTTTETETTTTTTVPTTTTTTTPTTTIPTTPTTTTPTTPTTTTPATTTPENTGGLETP